MAKTFCSGGFLVSGARGQEFAGPFGMGTLYKVYLVRTYMIQGPQVPDHKTVLHDQGQQNLGYDLVWGPHKVHFLKHDRLKFTDMENGAQVHQPVVPNS